MTHHVVLSLGANLGDPVRSVTSALEAIGHTPGVRLVATSRLYTTSPLGGPEQPDYINAVAIVETSLSPNAILDVAHQIENAHARVRTQHWGPRTLDIDVIAYDQEVSDEPILTIPHPRAHERAFVLVPWHEVEPDAVLATLGPIADLIEHVQDQEIFVVTTPNELGSAT